MMVLPSFQESPAPRLAGWGTVSSCTKREALSHLRVSFRPALHGRQSRSAALDASQLGLIAVEPVVKVAMLSGVGALCDKQNVLTPQGRRMLSGLVMNVFTPALLFSKLGSAVDIHQALELWPLAANMVVCHIVGVALGLLQAKLLDIPNHLRPQMMVMNAVGNIGNLPLVLVPSLIANPDSPFSSASQDLGITYVMLGFFCASFIQFPIGYLLLQQQQLKQQQQQQSVGLQTAQLTQQVQATAVMTSSAGYESENRRGSTLQPQYTQQQQQQQTTYALSTPSSQLPQQKQARAVSPLSSPVQQQQQQHQQQLNTLMKGIFTPPVIACLLSVPVASVPELRDALFTPIGSLSAVGDCISLLGTPLIPCLFLVLGANLAQGPGAAKVQPKYITGLIIGKLIIHPLAGMAVVLGSLHYGLLPRDTDTLELLVMLLVWSTPTAVLVHSLATMLQAGEDEVSCFLFWQYLASLVTLPAFMAVYLQLLQNGQLILPAG